MVETTTLLRLGEDCCLADFFSDSLEWQETEHIAFVLSQVLILLQIDLCCDLLICTDHHSDLECIILDRRWIASPRLILVYHSELIFREFLLQFAQVQGDVVLRAALDLTEIKHPCVQQIEVVLWKFFFTEDTQLDLMLVSSDLLVLKVESFQL